MPRQVLANSNKQTLSSSVLFYFTPKFDYILDIIRNGIWVRSGFEKLPKGKVAYITPMACFCDIPLGSIKEHLSWYGDYGIGVRRKYLREQGVTPVLYISSDSEVIPMGRSKKVLDELRRNPITPFLKPWYGKERVQVGDKISERYKRFYDEKEWRYIPKEVEVEVYPYNNIEELELIVSERNKGEKLRLPIPYEQIEYLIVRNIDEVKFLSMNFKGANMTASNARGYQWPTILTSSKIRRDL